MKLDPVVIPVDCMLINKWKLLLNVVSVVKIDAVLVSIGRQSTRCNITRARGVVVTSEFDSIFKSGLRDPFQTSNSPWQASCGR